MKEQLFEAFYQRFKSTLLWIIVTLIGSSFVLLFVILDYINKIDGLEAVIIGVFLMLIVLVVSFVIIGQYVLDVIAIKRETYKTITGKVEYIKCVDCEDNTTRVVHNPIVKDDLTGKKIKLKVIKRAVGNSCRYTFLYLPHTKLACVLDDLYCIEKLDKNS